MRQIARCGLSGLRRPAAVLKRLPWHTSSSVARRTEQAFFMPNIQARFSIIAAGRCVDGAISVACVAALACTIEGAGRSRQGLRLTLERTRNEVPIWTRLAGIACTLQSDFGVHPSCVPEEIAMTPVAARPHRYRQWRNCICICLRGVVWFRRERHSALFNLVPAAG
jgi:hypothetical protein